MKYFISEDGSAKHIIEFNAETGEYLHSVGGQAWALYGFILSYIHTKEARYLETLEKIADYFIANIPESKLIPVDFRQPETPAYEDSTTAAIVSCGLLELANYEDAAEYLLNSIFLNMWEVMQSAWNCQKTRILFALSSRRSRPVRWSSACG